MCLGADGILSPVPYAYGRVKLPVLSRLRTVQEPRSKDMLDPINPSFDSPKMISFSSTFQKTLNCLAQSMVHEKLYSN